MNTVKKNEILINFSKKLKSIFIITNNFVIRIVSPPTIKYGKNSKHNFLN